MKADKAIIKQVSSGVAGSNVVRISSAVIAVVLAVTIVHASPLSAAADPGSTDQRLHGAWSLSDSDLKKRAGLVRVVWFFRSNGTHSAFTDLGTEKQPCEGFYRAATGTIQILTQPGPVGPYRYSVANDQLVVTCGGREPWTAQFVRTNASLRALCPGLVPADADEDSFAYLGFRLGRDKDHVWERNAVKKDVEDPASYRFLEAEYFPPEAFWSRPLFFRDRKHVYVDYYLHHKIADVDFSDFVVLGHLYSRSGGVIRYCDQVIESADAQTFVYIREGHARDKRAIYRDGKRLTGSALWRFTRQHPELKSYYEREVRGKYWTFGVGEDVNSQVNAKTDGFNFQWSWDKEHLFRLEPMTSSVASLDLATSQMQTKADQLFTAMKGAKDIKRVDRKSEMVNTGPFRGQQVQFFHVENSGRETHLYLLGLWDGSRGWSGVYTTTATNDIARVHQILGTARKGKSD